MNTTQVKIVQMCFGGILDKLKQIHQHAILKTHGYTIVYLASWFPDFRLQNNAPQFRLQLQQYGDI